MPKPVYTYVRFVTTEEKIEKEKKVLSHKCINIYVFIFTGPLTWFDLCSMS